MTRIKTYGWDLVHAMSLSVINDMLEHGSSVSPLTFQQTDASVPDVPYEERDQLTGSFGAWRFTPGGSQAEVRMLIPVNLISGQSYGRPLEGKEFEVIVGVRLRHLDSKFDPDCLGRKSLVLETEGLDDLPAVNIVAFDYGSGAEFGSLASATVRGLLDQWLNANLVQFQRVLHLVKLDRVALDQKNQWLQPTDCSYAYCDYPAKLDGALGLLCVTSGNATVGLVQQASEDLIPQGCNTSYVIGGHRVLGVFILPNLTKIFQGTKDGDFIFQPASGAISTTRKSVPFQYKNAKGELLQATIENLEISFQGDRIVVLSTTATLVEDGLWETISGDRSTLISDCTHWLTLNTTLSGVGAEEAPTLTMDAALIEKKFFVDKPDSVEIREADWNLALASVNLLSLITGDIIVPGPIELAITFEAQINSLIQLTVSNRMDQIDDPIVLATIDMTAPFSFPSGSKFVLQQVMLDDSLVFAGTTHAA